MTGKRRSYAVPIVLVASLIAMIAAGAGLLWGVGVSGRMLQTTPLSADLKVTGRAFPYTLQAPSRRWRMAKDAYAKANFPQADRWLVEPISDYHLAVTGGKVGAGLRAEMGKLEELVLAALKTQLTNLELLEPEDLPTPLYAAKLLHYRGERNGDRFEYFHALYAAEGTAYEVIAWTYQKRFEAARPELRAAIDSFTVPQSPMQAANVRLEKRLKEYPEVAAFLDAEAKKGIDAEAATRALVARGSKRLTDKELAQRHRLKLTLLKRSPEDVCAAFARGTVTGEQVRVALETFNEAEANGWTQVSIASMLAELEQQPFEPVSQEAFNVEFARILDAGTPDSQRARTIVDNFAASSDPDVCWVEQYLGDRILEASPEARALLLRRLAGN